MRPSCASVPSNSGCSPAIITPQTPTRRMTPSCSAVGRSPIHSAGAFKLFPFLSVVVSSVDARGPRRTDREQVEAQPFDRDDIADVGLVEQVTAPDAELEVL